MDDVALGTCKYLCSHFFQPCIEVEELISWLEVFKHLGSATLFYCFAV